MAEKTMCIVQQQPKPIRIQKWKVNETSTVAIGRVILLYNFENAENDEQRKMKSSQAGTVHRIVANEGAIVAPGDILCELRPCSHPTIMNDMCAECGSDLRKDNTEVSASVPMVHAIPDLKVSEEMAQKIGKADGDRLLKDRKLVLLVDLDQTLIHTTNDNVPSNLKDVYHFQLYEPNSQWYHTRLRPGTHKFLDNIHPYFELHICTFGARNYAHMIAMFLDKDQRLFGNRILSRDECFDSTSKKANLKALFPCGDNMVCIIDDREDVWNYAANLIHVKPYHFFQHTGDINAPPGLDKHEDDNKAGIDLSKFKGNKQKDEEKSLESNGDKELEIPPDLNYEEKNENQIGETNGEPENNVEKPEEEKPLKDKLKNSEKEKEVEEKTEENGKEVINEATNNEESENVEKPIEEKKVNEPVENGDKPVENMIEVEDPDDYLLHLENILKKIHTTFYENYDRMESGEVPDLKKVIPTVRSLVLKGCKLVFSGLVPTHQKLEQSKAYQIARNLGAEVTQDLTADSTHLVALRPGTAKVNAGRRRKNLKIVTPDWLWCCAERWEHAEERVFPLNSKGSKNRHPPPHCSSPEHVTNYAEHATPAQRKRTPSGRFMDTINPLMSFSSDDIADMDKEVEDILDDESSEEEIQPEEETECEKRLVGEEEESSEDSLDSDVPKGHKRKRDGEFDEVVREATADSRQDDDDTPSVKFRRGENIDDELDMENDSADSEGSEDPPDEVDDGEWNMMGAALEREFLSNN